MAKPTYRLVLIYTGKYLYTDPKTNMTVERTYTEFSTEDLAKMEKASGFVLTGNPSFNVYGSNYEAYRKALHSQIGNLPKKPFYIGLPPINASDNYAINAYDYSWLKSFVDEMMADIEQLGILSSFKGFYFTTERVFGTVDASAPTSNPMVQLLDDLSKLIRKTYKKQFIWAPYLGYNVTYREINENLGIIANRTNIFSLIFLQSCYYFKEEREGYKTKNLQLAVRCAEKNTAYNYKEGSESIISTIPIGEQKTSTTWIGIDIEADEKMTSSDVEKRELYKKNYMKSRTAYAPLFTNGQCPFLFYAGSHDAIIDRNLFQTIQAFYDDGSLKYPEVP